MDGSAHMFTRHGEARATTATADGLNRVVADLRWAHLTLTLRAEETVHLPPYAGSTFRGAFGHAFKRVACPLRRECEGCAHQTVCVYAYVFETPGASDGSPLARGGTIAHPFVLEPPETSAREIPSGAELTLGLVLIGRAIPLAPYFLAACREMVRRGIGQGRKRLRLERAVAADPDSSTGRVVYDGAADLLAPAVPVWSAGDLPAAHRPASERVRLEFVTPTRLRQNADLVVKPEFTTLATALLRRVSVLAEVHCGAQPRISAREILAPAADVKVEKSELRWHDWERYSARQDTRMALGGFVGRITFAGPLDPWLPLLRLGEVLHVGKGTAFGLGRYRIEASDS
jgi:hypothetical protein